MKYYVLLIFAAILFSQHKTHPDMKNETIQQQVQTFPATHINVSMNRPANEVYEYSSNPENLPQWAKGLSSTVKKEGDHWLMDSPMGKVKVKFVEKNTFGIIDHYVTLPSGETVYNPVRILPNNEGSEVIFTLFRLPGRTDEDFQQDAATVRADLQRLKEIMQR
jgi:uncharacterized membrane protein